MEGATGGILGRLGEKILGWIALALLVVLGYALYAMGDAGRQAIWSGIWKTAVWLLVAATLPWSSKLFIRRILEVGSNWAGVALLGAYVLVEAVLGLLLLGGAPGGGWGWVAAVTALAVAGSYNFLVAEYLSERAGL